MRGRSGTRHERDLDGRGHRTIAHSFASAVTAGSCIVVIIGHQNANTATVSSVTDNAGGGSNTYQEATKNRTTPGSARCYSHIWYAMNVVAASGTHTVTVTSQQSPQ